MKLLLRIVLFLLGLVVAASLAIVFVMLIAFWLLRSTWARITGKPVTPFVMRVDPRAGFGRAGFGGAGFGGAGFGDMHRGAHTEAEDLVDPSPSLQRHPRAIGDVTDVEAKP